MKKGYFLTTEQLARLVRDFEADRHDGFVSNDELYIDHYMKDKGIESLSMWEDVTTHECTCKTCKKKFKSNIKDADMCPSCYF